MRAVSARALRVRKILFFSIADTVLYILQKKMGPKEEFTFPQEWKRKSVLFAIRAGHHNATIAKFFDLTTTWVWKVRNHLEESGGDTKLWQKDPVTKEGLTASELPNRRQG